MVASGSVREALRGAFGDVAFTHVRVSSEDELLWVVLNRPDRLNAMTDLMLSEFKTIYEGVERGGWRCIVIAGAGRAFCSGADLGQISGVIDFADAEQIREYLDTGWQRVVTAMREVAVPTVAAVHGSAYGGGANLALAADLVVAAESTVFCQSYINHGISPDLGGTVLLPRLVGMQHARKQLLLGDQVSAAEALRTGMVCEVVPDAQLRTRAREIAALLAAKDPAALNVTRRLIDDNASLGLRAGLANESRGIGQTLSSPNFSAATSRYHRAQPGPAHHEHP